MSVASGLSGTFSVFVKFAEGEFMPRCEAIRRSFIVSILACNLIFFLSFERFFNEYFSFFYDIHKSMISNA